MNKNKDPAVLFYTSDFLSGVADLTMAERGQYITLLCLQHQKGRLSKKTILLSVGKVSSDVLAKFRTDEEGCYYNTRMEEEIKKRAAYSQSRAKNRKGKSKSHISDIAERDETDENTPISEEEKATDEYISFTFSVMEYFTKNRFESSAIDFITYNESRGWRGIGGEDVRDDFTRYADRWEKTEKGKIYK